MKLPLALSAFAAFVLVPGAAHADSVARSHRAVQVSGGKELPAYLQCVPYARQLSGIQIYGDAHSWWGQAEGRYQRGNRPRVGAVMAFRPHGNMRLGHVAAVSRVIDSRTVLLDHANWSPIDGRRGQVERDVKAIDVSPDNDWSMVRVWYDPLGGLGKTAWPVHGFIYSDRDRQGPPPRTVDRPPVLAAANPPQAPSPPASDRPSRAFSAAFASGFSEPKPTRLADRATPRRDVVASIIAGAR